MKLWLISQDENPDYDTYDSAVVAAETEEEARLTNPDGYGKPVDWARKYSTWASGPEHVKVEYIGEAKEGTKAGVICASFNAG